MIFFAAFFVVLYMIPRLEFGRSGSQQHIAVEKNE